jgi:hypothetical protein
MWSFASSAFAIHASDAPSTSDIQVGKKNTTVKFPCMLCKGDHYSHLSPRMDETSSLLEKLQLLAGYRRISPNPSLVDGMVNLVPFPVNPIDQVVNLVSSLVEPLTKVVDPSLSSINPSFHLESETQVIDPVFSLVSPTLHSKSVKVVDPVLSSVDPTPSLRSAKVVNMVLPPIDLTHPKSTKVTNLVPSSVSPTLHLKSSILVDLIPSSIDPTLPLESKPDTAHIFLVDTGSTMLGNIPPSPVKPLPSNEAILFDWGVLTGPHLPSHIPFQITVQVYGRDIPQMLIDEGVSLVFCPLLLGTLWVVLNLRQLHRIC